MSIFKRKATWGEALFGRKEHKIQMRRVRQGEKEWRREEKRRGKK